MRGIAVGAFKLVAGTLPGAVVGYLSARAGFGAFGLDGSDVGLGVAAVTGLATMMGGHSMLARAIQARSARAGVVIGTVAGVFFGASAAMDRSLTAANINDHTQERALTFRGACGPARIEKAGNEARFVLPAQCRLVKQ